MSHPTKVIGFSKRTTIMDVKCVLMGRLGFSYNLIAKETGLSHGQIGLRLKQTESKISDYRDGKSEIAKRVLEGVSEQNKILVDQIRAQIQKLIA